MISSRWKPGEIGKFSDNSGWKSNRGKGCTRVINVTRSKHNMAEIWKCTECFRVRCSRRGCETGWIIIVERLIYLVTVSVFSFAEKFEIFRWEKVWKKKGGGNIRIEMYETLFIIRRLRRHVSRMDTKRWKIATTFHVFWNRSQGFIF